MTETSDSELRYWLPPLGKFLLVCLLAASHCSYAVESAAVQPNSKQALHVSAKQVQRVCSYVAARANNGTLEKLARGTPENRSYVPVPEPQLESSGYPVYRDFLDINNDGKPEFTYVMARGTAHYQYVAAIEAGSSVLQIEFLEDGSAADVLILSFEGINYLVNKTEAKLESLTRIDPDNKERLVCEFAQRKFVRTRVAWGTEPEVCRAILAGRVKPVAFDIPNSADLTFPGGGYGNWNGSFGKAALVDVDNNGELDFVIQTDSDSTAGRGCSYKGLALLNEDLETLVDSETSKKLVNEVGGECHNARLLPVLYKGITYLENRTDSTTTKPVHFVERFDGGSVKRVCGFEERLVNYVRRAIP